MEADPLFAAFDFADVNRAQVGNFRSFSWLRPALAAVVADCSTQDLELLSLARPKDVLEMLIGAFVSGVSAPLALWGLYRLVLWRAFGAPIGASRVVLKSGALAFVFCGPLPPWLYTVNLGAPGYQGIHAERNAGY